jgi:hypothetical protein
MPERNPAATTHNRQLVAPGCRLANLRARYGKMPLRGSHAKDGREAE